MAGLPAHWHWLMVDQKRFAQGIPQIRQNRYDGLDKCPARQPSSSGLGRRRSPDHQHSANHLPISHCPGRTGCRHWSDIGLFDTHSGHRRLAFESQLHHGLRCAAQRYECQ